MIVAVFLGQRVSVFPVDVHVDSFKNDSTMCMIEDFLYIVLSANFKNLLSLSKILPFIFEHILELT